MRWWHRLHSGPRWPRRATKLAVLGVVVGLALYPRFWLIPTWLGRLANMNSVLQPDHPGLAALEQDVRDRTAADSLNVPTVRLSVVQAVVYEHLPYAWDWQTWGVFDFLPNVDEALRLGREDCDGRAVVAASLLRRLGHDAWLVSDLLHVWVQTPDGETMSPGAGETTLVATSQGTRPRFSMQLVRNALRGLSYGVAVFPWGRELIIVAALCAVSLQPDSSRTRRAVGCTALLVALLLLRYADNAANPTGPRGGWLSVLAVVTALAGWLLLVLKGGGRGWPPRPPESPATGG